MAEDREGLRRARASDADAAPASGPGRVAATSDASNAPDNASNASGDVSSASGDSLLRAAAEISEPSASEAEAYGAGEAPGALVAGTIIAKRYRLDRKLGRGGMGVVWEATHRVTRRRVAIKFVTGTERERAGLRRRFLREARTATAANHPNVVEVLDVFELDDGTPVMVMELLRGETLRERLVRERILSLESTAAILLPVVAGVGAAHALGIVHRDLKPENIFLLQGAEPGANVKVLDFGVAKLTANAGEAVETEPITGTGATLGTPCYMAPEQATGEKDIDARADIWALGVVLYECLAGARPVEGSGIGQVVMKLMTEGIKPLDQVTPGLPPEASALVMRMLARERRDRPEDLRQVQDVLARFTTIDPRKFEAPGTLGPGEDEDEDEGEEAREPLPVRPPRGAPLVDTQSPQSIPNRMRPTSRRSSIAIAATGALIVAAFAGSRASVSRPSPTSGPRASAFASGAAPAVSLPLAASTGEARSEAASSASSSTERTTLAATGPGAALRPVRVDGPRPDPAKPERAGSFHPRPAQTAVATSAEASIAFSASSAEADPVGLAEKPPF